MIVRLHPHALERLAERGATEEEVRATVLARIIHEHFCCNRGFATATSLDAVGPASRQAGSPLSRSTSCSRMPPSLAAPRACRTWRLRDFATNRHE